MHEINFNFYELLVQRILEPEIIDTLKKLNAKIIYVKVSRITVTKSQTKTTTIWICKRKECKQTLNKFFRKQNSVR